MTPPVTQDPRPVDETGLFELAPAKINLALHVTGQRPDGYHLLESIVTFVDPTNPMGADQLGFFPAEQDQLAVFGPFSHLVPLDAEGADGNLVLKARDLLRRTLRGRGIATGPVSIRLDKNLPVAAGIGGGSTDAAATLRGLSRLWKAELPAGELASLALSLGADVPMCLRGEPLLVKGIGEALTTLPTLPALPLVLGNPMVGVSTPDVFRRLTTKENMPIGPLSDDWIAMLRVLRNDLEPPARSLTREIDQISGMIGAEGAIFTRMSGSGATCFGLFPSLETAQTAAEHLSARKPDWYFQAVQTVGRAP